MQEQQEQVLEYKFTVSAKNFLIEVLNAVEVKGIQNHQNVLMMVDILNKPLNMDAIEKEAFDKLKEKYDKSSSKTK